MNTRKALVALILGAIPIGAGIAAAHSAEFKAVGTVVALVLVVLVPIVGTVATGLAHVFGPAPRPIVLAQRSAQRPDHPGPATHTGAIR